MEQSQAKIYEVLKKYWGYDEFRPKQLEIINSVLAGRDTLALLPTGGGKSLTYQVPALVMDGLCIVVTPLIALMKDQVDRLRANCISAVAVHSGLSKRQIDIALDNCTYGDVKFLYLSPERLATESFRLRVQRMNVSLLAIDEAHSISQWGYDFRPSYLRIAEVLPIIGNAPILALTASATEMVANDIMSNLKFSSPHIIRGSFTRSNLVYAVRRVEDKDQQLLRIIGNVEGSGIVYARTRAGAERIATMLEENGVASTFYHGGLPFTERTIRQDEWVKGKVRIMVATNAFGMGIDKGDVRFVVHYAMSDSLESYYQEAGRAGRDGRRSFAVLLVSPDDHTRIKRQIEGEFVEIDKVKDIYERICSSLQIAVGDGGLTSHNFNLFEFCGKERLYRGVVVSALKLLQMNNYMSITDEMEQPARVMFTVSRDELYKVRIDHDELDHFIRTLLRLYEGLFTSFRRVSESEIAYWSGYTVDKVNELLKRMWQIRIIRYIPSNCGQLICLHQDRLPTADLYISPETYKYRRDLYFERFDHMLHYSENESVCRSAVLEHYFGCEEIHDCGVCDICIDKRRGSGESLTDVIRKEIVDLLKNGDMNPKQLVSQIKRDPKLITQVIDSMIINEEVRQSVSGKLKL